MRAVIQRANGAQVSVDGEVLGGFDGPGIVLLVGVTHDDDTTRAAAVADKVYGLRIFEHRHARDLTCLPPSAPREISARDLGLPVLVISQFTLYASTKKGRRPTWDAAAPGPVAEPLVEAVAQALRELGAEVSHRQVRCGHAGDIHQRRARDRHPRRLAEVTVTNPRQQESGWRARCLHRCLPPTRDRETASA